MGWFEGSFRGSCWLWGLNRERLGWWVVWLEVGINVGRDVFSGGTIGADDGMARVARFVNFRK